MTSVKNDSVEPSKILSSVKYMKKLVVKIKGQNQHFRILELTNGSQQSGEPLFKKNFKSQEEQRALWCFNLLHSHSLHTSSVIALKTTASQPMKANSLAATGKRRTGLEFFQSSTQENFHYLTSPVVPWKIALAKLS